ncbi:hypothetical protein [Sanyastnella coralliicola]|uniref:hypothetical protein n=1 Tax=Sanyastnella coralliicola TaxID=3069118 RepID=UPI0027B9B0F8|nr:hypothetical protein [Longitalea sp. SCSIO 12813]
MTTLLRISLLSFLFISFAASAQNNWVNTTFWNIGFSPTIASAPIVKSETNSSEFNSWSAYDNTSGLFPWGHFTADYLGEHFHVHSDPATSWAATFLVVATNRLVNGNYSDSVTVDQTSFIFDPLRVSFGGWVNDRLGVYGGVQYSYVFTQATVRALEKIDPSSNEVLYSNPRIGGHCLGINGTGFYTPSDKLLISYTFLIDRVSNSKGFNKGIGIGNIGKVNYRIGEWLGAFISFEHRFIRMKPTENGTLDDLNRDFKVYYTDFDVEALTGSILEFNVGITILGF